MSLSVWTAGPNHEWESMQAWLGGGPGHPLEAATEAGGAQVAGAAWHCSASGTQSISARLGTTEGGWRKSLCGSSRTSLGNSSKTLQPTSVTSRLLNRESQTGRVDSERSAGTFPDCVLRVGTHQRGEPWALREEILQNKGKRKHHSKDSEEEQASEMNLL